MRTHINLTVAQELKAIGDKFKQSEEVKNLSVQITAIRKKQCSIRKMLRGVRDKIAIRHGWVRQPDIVVNEVLQLRRRDAKFIRTRTHFVLPRFEILMKLKRYYYPTIRTY